MREVSVDVTTTGGAGAATGTAQMGVGGSVSTMRGLRIVYGAGAPATTTVTVSNDGRNLLAAPASNTSKHWLVKEQGVDPTGALIAGSNGYAEPVVHGTIQVAVAASNALSPAVSVVVYLDDSE